MSATTTNASGATVLRAVLQSWEKGQRTLSMYLPNNPVRQQTIEGMQDGLADVWEHVPNFTLTVSEAGLQWGSELVLPIEDKAESLGWTLFRDGIRWISFAPGVETELVTFLGIVQRARTLMYEDQDDLRTLPWSADLQFVRYKEAELRPGRDGETGEDVGDGMVALETPKTAAEDVRGFVLDEVAQVGGQYEAGEARGQEGSQPEGGEAAPTEGEEGQVSAPPPKGVVNLSEFQSTLYFLDKQELSYLKAEVHREYEQNLNQNVLSMLFDIFEAQADPETRAEIISILGELLPSLLYTGDFHSVAYLISEAQVVLSHTKDILPAHRQLLDGLARTLSKPEAVGQLVEALDVVAVEPSPDAIAALFAQLKPAALSPLLKWHKRLQNADARRILQGAISRMAEARPASVGAALEASERVVVIEALGLVSELGVRGVEDRLVALGEHEDVAVRTALIPALAAAPTSQTMAVLVGFMRDPDSEIRIAAVAALALKRYRGALLALEETVLGKEIRSCDLSERKAFFAAYGSLAGDSCVSKLSEILLSSGFWRSVDSETRACAAMALGNVLSQSSRAVLQRAIKDRDPVVRAAAMRALRQEAS
jgi:HEAT repeat protein